LMKNAIGGSDVDLEANSRNGKEEVPHD
jgi:hypothetical protein